ncbi:MAG: hypothetical protein GY851_03285 [bacterium]|nr:hypothetical protein [bacterium]
MSRKPNPLRWVPCSIAAKQLSISKDLLVKWSLGGGRFVPTMPSRRRKGVIQVQPSVAYEHLKEHGQRVRNFITPPDGYDLPQPKVVVVERKQPEDITHEDINEHGHLVIKQWVDIAEAERKALNDEARRASLLKPDQYVRELRGAVQMSIKHIEAGTADRLAVRLVAVLRERFAVDLRKRPGVASVLKRAVLEELNESMDLLRQDVEDRCAKGVK